jgi:predicted Zn-dependent protease
VTIQSAARGNTRFAVNQVSTAGDSYDAAVVVRSVFGRRAANAVTNKLDDASLRAVVSAPRRWRGSRPRTPSTSPSWARSSTPSRPATRRHRRARRRRPRGRRARGDRAGARRDLVATGYLETQAGATAVANSKGLFAYNRQTGASMTTTGAHARRHRLGVGGRRAPGLGEDRRRRAGRARHRQGPPLGQPGAVEPGRYTVVLEPTAVGNLLQLMAFAMNARAADEGRSFFTKQGGGNKIGQKVVDERVTITSDPADPDAPGRRLTGDGLPTRRTVWIENGVVKNLAYDRYWAQRQSREPVPLVPSLRMSGGTASLEEMIASTERGLLVTRLWYIRPVDPRTILYTGADARRTFLIERGKITRAVKNLRWNESPVFLLNNLEAMGPAGARERERGREPGGGDRGARVKARDFTVRRSATRGVAGRGRGRRRPPPRPCWPAAAPVEWLDGSWPTTASRPRRGAVVRPTRSSSPASEPVSLWSNGCCGREHRPSPSPGVPVPPRYMAITFHSTLRSLHQYAVAPARGPAGPAVMPLMLSITVLPYTWTLPDDESMMRRRRPTPRSRSRCAAPC